MRTSSGVAAPHVLQAVDGIKGVGEGHAVCQKANALLELLDRGLGVGTVLAVDRAAGEAQDVETLLELAHVVAMEVWEAQVERAVTKLVALVHQCGPGSSINDVAQRQTVVEPKARDGGGCRMAKGLLGSFLLVDLISQRAQALLDVLHGGARRAFANWFHTLVPLDIVGVR